MKGMEGMKATPELALWDFLMGSLGEASIPFMPFMGRPQARQFQPPAAPAGRRTTARRGDLRVAPSSPSDLFCMFIDQGSYPVEILRDSSSRRNRGPHFAALAYGRGLLAVGA